MYHYYVSVSHQPWSKKLVQMDDDTYKKLDNRTFGYVSKTGL